MTHMMNQLLKINELVIFKHSIFSLPFIFIAMIVASIHESSTPWFGWRLLFLGILAAVSARNVAMAFNRLVDKDIDKKNPRTISRPSVDGRVEEKNIRIFIAVNAFIFILVAYFVNSLAFWLSFPMLVVLMGYSLVKRFSSVAHIVLGSALALAPIAGAVAVSASIPLWVLLLSCGVLFWVGGFDLLYSLQDMEFDRNEGLFSIPSIYGKDATLFISALFHFVAVLFWLFFTMAANLGFWAYVAVLISAVVLFLEHRIVIKNMEHIDRAFFTLNGYLGIVYFVCILLDVF